MGIGAALASVTACADDTADLDHLSCAGLAFPEDTQLVSYQADENFRDQTTVAVVDVPAASIDAFKQQSGLTRFDPGVPPQWKPFWDKT
ncbi:hypothetical protein, partial [Streptomyces roseolus]|uniref:hypothetical protein n=1 Tax=Streptomyces roseolus TaxID=67358 RepID=UPI0036492A69